MEGVCPICNEMWDKNDSARFFFPCPCGFQMCSFCFNNLRKTSNKCPCCRTIYNESNYKHTESKKSGIRKKSQLDQGLHLQQPIQPNAVREKTQDLIRMNVNPSIMSNKVLYNFVMTNPAEDLKTVRVLQKNLVYVTGIPNDITDDQLRSPNMFGQYGHVIKLVPRYANTVPGLQSATAYTNKALYVTYSTNEEAYRCIFSCHRTYFDGGLLNALYGTTKFCKNFLMGVKCTNPDCMYLHSADNSIIIFTKSGMSSEMFKQRTQIDVFRTIRGTSDSEGNGRLEEKLAMVVTRETFEANKTQRERLPPAFDRKHEKVATITQAPWSKRKSELGEEKKGANGSQKTSNGTKRQSPQIPNNNDSQAQGKAGDQGQPTTDNTTDLRNDTTDTNNNQPRQYDCPQDTLTPDTDTQKMKDTVILEVTEPQTETTSQQTTMEYRSVTESNNREPGRVVVDRRICTSMPTSTYEQDGGCFEDEKIVDEENTEDLLEAIFGENGDGRAQNSKKRVKSRQLHRDRSGSVGVTQRSNPSKYVQKDYNHRRLSKKYMALAVSFSSFSIELPGQQHLLVPLPFEVEFD